MITLIRTCCLSLLLLTAHSAMAETLYRWVDDKGRVTYQGQPPLKKNYTQEEIAPASGAAATTTTEPQVKIVIYAVEECEACALVRQDLQARGLSFTELNPEQDLAVGKAMIEQFGKVEVPIILVGDSMVRGHNPNWLTAELEKAGISAAAETP